MNQTVAHRILIIDPGATIGDLIAFVLKYKYNDAAQVVLSRDAGWASLEAEPPDVVFIYLRADGLKATGCRQWLRSLWHPLPAEQPRLTQAAEFCQRLRSIPKLKHVPVIVFGAMAPGQIYAELQEAGATGYLSLPCDPKEIMAARDAAVRGETYYPPLEPLAVTPMTFPKAIVGCLFIIVAIVGPVFYGPVKAWERLRKALRSRDAAMSSQPTV